jgi:hypothetical protein
LSRKNVKKIAIGDGFSIMLGKDISAEEQKAKRERKKLR